MQWASSTPGPTSWRLWAQLFLLPGFSEVELHLHSGRFRGRQRGESVGLDGSEQKIQQQDLDLSLCKF